MVVVLGWAGLGQDWTLGVLFREETLDLVSRIRSNEARSLGGLIAGFSVLLNGESLRICVYD